MNCVHAMLYNVRTNTVYSVGITLDLEGVIVRLIFYGRFANKLL